MKLEFKWNKGKKQLAFEKTGGKKGRLFLANEAKKLMDPYVPAKNLALAQNTRILAEGEHGVVEYNSPYAHYQYEGELYVDPKTGKGAFTDGERFWSRAGVAKIPSGKKLEYDTFRHPLATDHWDEAMMVARKADLAAAYQNYLNRGET